MGRASGALFGGGKGIGEWRCAPGLGLSLCIMSLMVQFVLGCGTLRTVHMKGLVFFGDIFYLTYYSSSGPVSFGLG